MTDPLFADPTRGAVLSVDRRYRYTLTRTWNADAEVIVWVGLNPSTADEHVDDPTIRRVVAFSKRWGYGGCVMLNLFAYRATDPRELAHAGDPVGERNAHYLSLECIDRAVVAAWGSSVPAGLRRHADRIGAWLRRTQCAYTLGLTADGYPRHPLYLRATAQPTRWVDADEGI